MEETLRRGILFGFPQFSKKIEKNFVKTLDKSGTMCYNIQVETRQGLDRKQSSEIFRNGQVAELV